MVRPREQHAISNRVWEESGNLLRLCSFVQGGRDTLGLVLDERVVAARDIGDDLPGSFHELLQRGDRGLAELGERLHAADPATAEMGLPIDELDLMAPVPSPGKIVAVGRNYLTHAEESGADMPEAPLLFAKYTSSLIGHGDEVTWHADLTSQVDWEAELAVVIGRPTYRVAEEEALASILGYTCLNDVSARDLQLGDGQWVRGKSLDTFCPMGPVLVTADEIPDPHALPIRCVVNGVVMQEDVTGHMHFSISKLISFASHAFTLWPGDVIATGTPSGVGVYRDPPVFLADGDEVIVEIDGIGSLRNTCRVIVA